MTSETRGAPHGADVAFVFDHLDFQEMDWRPEDRAISAAMADYWTNFARSGDPNGPGLPPWSIFSDVGEPESMVFHGEPHMGPLLDPEHYAALEGTSRGAGARRENSPD